MLITFLEVVSKGIGYSLILYGFWLLSGNSFYNTYVKSGIRKYKGRRRIKRLRELESESRESKDTSSIIKHLEILLTSVSKKSNVHVTNFIMLSLIIFIVTTILLIVLVGDPFFALIVGLLVGVSPYLLVIYRLEAMRLKTSLAFLNEFHVILQNYQSTNKNVYYTLLNTVEDLENKDMKKQFRKLISSFQKERHDTDFKKHVHIFIFSINSTFAKRFGNLLIKAHLENVDIGNSLVGLNEDITHRKKDMEDESTEKLQTVMVGFAPIIVLPIMVFFAYQVAGVVDFWYFFKKDTNLTMFIFTVICCVVSVLLAFLIRKPKADI